MKVEIDTDDVLLMRAVADAAVNAYEKAPDGCVGGGDGAVYIYGAHAVAKVLEGMDREAAVKDAIENAGQPHEAAMNAAVVHFRDADGSSGTSIPGAA